MDTEFVAPEPKLEEVVAELVEKVAYLEKQVNDECEVIVPIQIDEGGQMPTYAKPGSAGADVFSSEDIRIQMGESKVVPTAIRISVPEGYEVNVKPRSGMSLKTTLRVANAPGTIDPRYVDVVGIILFNDSIPTAVTSHDVLDIEGKSTGKVGFPGTYEVKAGDRIAQLVLNKVAKMKFMQVDDITTLTDSRGGGFGSSGTR